jgi:hypothetical protein
MIEANRGGQAEAAELPIIPNLAADVPGVGVVVGPFPIDRRQVEGIQIIVGMGVAAAERGENPAAMAVEGVKLEGGFVSSSLQLPHPGNAPSKFYIRNILS